MYILKHWFLLEKNKESRSLCLGNYMLTYIETTIINKNKLLIAHVLKLQTYQEDK